MTRQGRSYLGSQWLSVIEGLCHLDFLSSVSYRRITRGGFCVLASVSNFLWYQH